MRLVFLQGGNICKLEGEGKEVGDDLAHYVDNGGIVCTIGTFFFKKNLQGFRFFGTKTDRKFKWKDLQIQETPSFL